MVTGKPQGDARLWLPTANAVSTAGGEMEALSLDLDLV